MNQLAKGGRLPRRASGLLLPFDVPGVNTDKRALTGRELRAWRELHGLELDPVIEGRSGQQLVQTANAGVYTATNTGNPLVSSAALTDVSPGGLTAGQAFQMQSVANLQAGQRWRVTATGILSTTGTPTMAIGLYYGGVAGVALGATAATTTPSAASNITWTLTATLRVLTLGTAGSILCQGTVQGLGGPNSNVMLPASSSTGGQTTINTSVASILTVGAQWGTSNASNTLTVYQYIVELMD